MWGAGYLVSRRKRSAGRAVVRIVAPPPGEAPFEVRQAWVGLELPLIPGQVEAQRLTGQQVLSGQPVEAPAGYAVDGATAVAALESVRPEAARWWRENAPDVLARGYQLVFPAGVCRWVGGPGA
jgi:hypothetical protein